MNQDTFITDEYQDVSKLSEYLQLDSRRYDSGFGSEQ